MGERTITGRMELALSELYLRWGAKRRPKAFYLNAADFSAFMATNPPTVQTMFGNNPPTLVTDPAFEGVPVRETASATSRLYNSTGAGCGLAA